MLQKNEKPLLCLYMLNKFRARHIKTTFWILLIVIIPSFAFWGVSSFIRGKRKNAIITVAGKPLSYSEFKEYLTMANIYYRLTMGQDFYAKTNQQMLETKAFQFILLLHKAKKDGIKASDKDVVKTIENIFSIKGRFNEEAYERNIKEQLMMTPRIFEEYIRKILTAGMVLDKYVRNVTVKEDEIKNLYKIDNEQVKLSYIYIPYSKLSKEVNVTDKEINDYYNGHKSNFSNLPRIKIRYILLDKDKDKTVIDKLLRRAENTKSIISIIKKFSLQFQTTGYFDRNHPPGGLKWGKKADELALSMPLNKLSPLIEEGRNYILFEKIAQEKGTTPSLDEVKDKIVDELKRDKIKTDTESKAKDILKSALSGKSSLSNIAKEYSLENNTTEYLTRRGLAEKTGISRDISEAIFGLKKGDIYPDIITVKRGVYIAKLEDFLPIDEDKFKKEKEDYRQRILSQKTFFRQINFFSQLEKEFPIKKLKQF